MLRRNSHQIIIVKLWKPSFKVKSNMETSLNKKKIYNIHINPRKFYKKKIKGNYTDRYKDI